MKSDLVASWKGLSAARSQKLCGYQERHGVLPPAIGQHTLFGTVGVHNQNLAILLKCVVVERSLVAETIESGDVVLVKGSRGVRTEKVIEKLLETFELEEKSTATTHSGR